MSAEYVPLELVIDLKANAFPIPGIALWELFGPDGVAKLNNKLSALTRQELSGLVMSIKSGCIYEMKDVVAFANWLVENGHSDISVAFMQEMHNKMRER